MKPFTAIPSFSKAPYSDRSSNEEKAAEQGEKATDQGEKEEQILPQSTRPQRDAAITGQPP